MNENIETEQPIIKINKKGSKQEPVIEIVEPIIECETEEPTSEISEAKTEMKQKLSGLVHPSRIKVKNPQKINLKLIKKIKTNPVNFF